ncbi:MULTISPECIES: DUF2946 family protein [Modicisalibacter]|uniref:DUF2946 family protein n=1 Tax=Modicisalibacter TaxID=574347 RepID=UPI00100A48A0|nr:MULTISPECIES: DUF2946 family protein [Halomonadaceae]MBZ9558915.1 DUF2946 domain-containing protein [Modicisalibacter sp. R2A 31.J]MBZ9575193.1 DUF2946 domain-containing protein [Modicisalibacter sp. MOD 31.J]
MAVSRPPHALRQAASCALLAMLLVVFGPLIGQLSGAAHATHGDAPRGIATAHEARIADHPAGVFAWHDACGYCTLFQHCPVLDVALPPAATASLAPLDQPAGAPRVAHATPALAAHAPPRAPPIALA